MTLKSRQVTGENCGYTNPCCSVRVNRQAEQLFSSFKGRAMTPGFFCSKNSCQNRRGRTRFALYIDVHRFETLCQNYSSLERRRRLSWLWRRLLSSRSWREAALGWVGRRGFGFSVARRIRATSRSRASSRLRS